MKKYFILILCVGMSTMFMTSCLDEYLNQSPESSLTEQDVFSKYQNFKKFFENVYGASNNLNIKCGYSLYFSGWDQKYTWDALTEMSDAGRRMTSQTIKGGTMGSTNVWYFTHKTDSRPILDAMFSIIRISNISLEKMYMLKDAKNNEIDDSKGQAFFVRAFAHFTLFKIWGRMPYLYHSLGANDEWDVPRLSNHETLMRIAADLDSATFYFKRAGVMRRDDPTLGNPGHLSNPDLYKPNGCAAMGLKGRVLLYAASPLNNERGIEDWKDAAKANWDAIQMAQEYGYFLLSAVDYQTNYVGVPYTDEQLWAWSAGNWSYNNSYSKGIINGVFAKSQTDWSGECPTQNIVDQFETAYGEPLNTEADRDAAIDAGHYNNQQPYINRDLRFYFDIIYNEAPIPGYTTAKIYYENVGGITSYSELLDQSYAGITQTGYYQRKLWGGQSVQNQISPAHTDPIIRLSELYLNYAEAANEAYGPENLANGAEMSAVDAINVIRNRVNMPNVQERFTTNTEVFRPRIKNERSVELCFEGHHYFDLRRWKDAPLVMSQPLIGMNIEKLATKSSTYPTGYKYTRIPLPSNRQAVWKDAMYYFPFYSSDMLKMKNFVPNELW